MFILKKKIYLNYCEIKQKSKIANIVKLGLYIHTTGIMNVLIKQDIRLNIGMLTATTSNCPRQFATLLIIINKYTFF